MKTAFITVITTLLVAFFSLFGRNIIDIAVLKANVISIEKKEIDFQNSMEDLSKNINDLHWYIITRKNIKVPRHDKTIRKRKR